MGRTLEGLTRALNRRTEAEPSPPVAVAIAPQPERSVEGELPGDDNTIPFIEVGGPRAPAPKLALLADAAPAVVEPARAQSGGAAPSAPPGPLLYLPVTFQAVPFTLRLPTGRAPVLSPELVAYHQPEHAVSGQYRSLWAELVESCPRGGNRILAFTSIAPASGTTTVSLNLAITAARDPQARVVLLDSDQRSPSAADRLGLAGNPGQFDWLEKPFPLGLALQETSFKNLHVLPAGKLPAPGRPPHAERLVLLADQLKQRFDWVLVDVGSWGAPAAQAWVRRCDAAFLVVRRPDGDAPEVGRVHEEIAKQGGPLKGYVLTGG